MIASAPHERRADGHAGDERAVVAGGVAAHHHVRSGAGLHFHIGDAIHRAARRNGVNDRRHGGANFPRTRRRSGDEPYRVEAEVVVLLKHDDIVAGVGGVAHRRGANGREGRLAVVLHRRFALGLGDVHCRLRGNLCEQHRVLRFLSAGHGGEHVGTGMAARDHFEILRQIVAGISPRAFQLRSAEPPAARQEIQLRVGALEQPALRIPRPQQLRALHFLIARRLAGELNQLRRLVGIIERGNFHPFGDLHRQ